MRLCLPLLPALIGARVGVLISVLVGVSTRCRVEAIAHVLTVCAPPHPVGPKLHWYLQPLVKVLCATIPSKDIGEVVATARLDLGEEPRLGVVQGRLQLGVILLWLSIGRGNHLLVLRIGDLGLRVVRNYRLVWSVGDVLRVGLWLGRAGRHKGSGNLKRRIDEIIFCCSISISKG